MPVFKVYMFKEGRDIVNQHFTLQQFAIYSRMHVKCRMYDACCCNCSMALKLLGVIKTMIKNGVKIDLQNVNTYRIVFRNIS